MTVEKNVVDLGCKLSLEHLPVPHLNGQEYHHQSRKPDATSTEPENTGASVGEQLCTGVRRNDTRNSTKTRQHTTYTAAVGSIEEFRRGSIEDSVEVLNVC